MIGRFLSILRGQKGEEEFGVGEGFEYIPDFLPETVDRYLLLNERDIRDKIEG